MLALDKSISLWGRKMPTQNNEEWYLAKDLFIKILGYLEYPTIVRFKEVNNTWRNIINSDVLPQSAKDYITAAIPNKKIDFNAIDPIATARKIHIAKKKQQGFGAIHMNMSELFTPVVHQPIVNRKWMSPGNNLKYFFALSSKLASLLFVVEMLRTGDFLKSFFWAAKCFTIGMILLSGTNFLAYSCDLMREYFHIARERSNRNEQELLTIIVEGKDKVPGVVIIDNRYNRDENYLTIPIPKFYSGEDDINTISTDDENVDSSKHIVKLKTA